MHQHRLGVDDWKATLPRKTLGSWKRAEHAPAMCPCGKVVQHLLGCIGHSGASTDPCPPDQHWREHTWSAGSRSGLPVREGHECSEVSPAEGHEGDQVPGASEIEGESGRAGAVQPGKEKAQGGSYHWVSVPDGKV